MAMNDLKALAPRILAKGLMALRNNTVLPVTVNRDYEGDAMMRGTTVDVPIPDPRAVTDVTPSSYKDADNPEDTTQRFRQIRMDQWKKVNFHLSDKDKKEIAEGTMIPEQISECVAALGQYIDAWVADDMYKSFYGYVGPGDSNSSAVAFSGVNDTKAVTRARAVLNIHKTPKTSDWCFVVDPDTEAKASDQRGFQDFSWASDATTIINGDVGKKFGFLFLMDQNMPTHTTTMSTGWHINGAVAAGARNDPSSTGQDTFTTIAVDNGGSGSPTSAKKGDLFYVTDEAVDKPSDRFYAVVENQAGANLTIYPSPRKGFADNKTLIPVATHRMALAYHKSAYAFVTRPFKDEDASGLGSIIMSRVDPLTGITLRLEISRHNKQTRYEFDVLFGGGFIRPEFGCRVAV